MTARRHKRGRSGRQNKKDQDWLENDPAVRRLTPAQRQYYLNWLEKKPQIPNASPSPAPPMGFSRNDKVAVEVIDEPPTGLGKWDDEPMKRNLEK